MSDYGEKEWMVYFPLYDIGNLNQYYRDTLAEWKSI